MLFQFFAADPPFNEKFIFRSDLSLFLWYNAFGLEAGEDE